MYIHIHVYTHTCIYTYIQTSSAKAPIAWQSRWKTWSPRWAKSKIWGKRWDKTSGKSEVKRCEKDVKLLLEPFFWNCFFGTILWNCFFLHENIEKVVRGGKVLMGWLWLIFCHRCSLRVVVGPRFLIFLQGNTDFMFMQDPFPFSSFFSLTPGSFCQ